MKIKIIIVFLISITLFSCKTEEDKRKEIEKHFNHKVSEFPSFANLNELLLKFSKDNDYNMTNIEDINNPLFTNLNNDLRFFNNAKKDSLKNYPKLNHTLFVYNSEDQFLQYKDEYYHYNLKSYDDNNIRLSSLVYDLVQIKNDYLDGFKGGSDIDVDKINYEIDYRFANFDILKYVVFVRYNYVITPILFKGSDNIENGFKSGYVCASVKVHDISIKKLIRVFDVYATNDKTVNVITAAHDINPNLFENLQEQVLYKLYYNKD